MDWTVVDREALDKAWAACPRRTRFRGLVATSYDMADPDEEAIAWDVPFGLMRDRFQETVHSMFRMIEIQKQSIANRAVRLRCDGHAEMKLEFKDPMEPSGRLPPRFKPKRGNEETSMTTTS